MRVKRGGHTEAGLGGDHPVIDGEAGDLGSHRKNLRHALVAAHSRRLGSDGVDPLDHVQIGRIDGRGEEADQHVLVTDLGQFLGLQPWCQEGKAGWKREGRGGEGAIE